MDPMGFYEVDNFVDYCEQEHKGNYETAFADWRIASERRKAERHASYNWMPWNLLKVRTSLNYPRFCSGAFSSIDRLNDYWQFNKD